jgi:hypothetical protein
MPYGRSREKFLAAVYRLAVAEGDVRARLRGAHWYLRQLTLDEIAPEHQDEFALLMNDLTWRGAERGPDGYIYRTALDHTITRMRNGAARRIAERIVALSHALT